MTPDDLLKSRIRKLKIIETNRAYIDKKIKKLYENRKSLNRKAKILRRQIGDKLI